MTRRIALLAYPRCQLLDVTGPWQVFATANDLAGTALYRLTLLAEEAGALTTNWGMVLHADNSWQALPGEEGIDTLLVAGGSGVGEQAGNQALLAKLRKMAPSVRRLGSVCTGAFLLAPQACSTATVPRPTGVIAKPWPMPIPPSTSPAMRCTSKASLTLRQRQRAIPVPG